LQGDAEAVRELVEHFEADKGAFVPQGSEALDIAAMLARYLRSLPEPLLTFKYALFKYALWFEFLRLDSV
jgi:hypothetical protein